MSSGFCTDASSYFPPCWLPGGHAQTLWPLLIRPRRVGLRRERWDTPDGDFVDVDFLDGPLEAPLVVLFHGLEGNSDSHYAQSLMTHVREAGWQGAVAHFRGCSGEVNRLPRAYHSGDADEIHWFLERFARRASRLFAVGVSLGGNALLKWTGTRGEAAGALLAGAAAVSAPMDIGASGRVLARGFNRIYTQNFLATLKRNALLKLGRFPGLYDRERVLAARDLHDFDDVVTAPLHGFRDVEDYWRRASSKPDLPGIRLPALILNAANDPFFPASCLPGAGEVSPWVSLDYPPEGGHVGFVSSPFPGNLDWLPQRLLGYFRGLMPQ